MALAGPETSARSEIESRPGKTRIEYVATDILSTTAAQGVVPFILG
ncbi:hypothetical protein CMEL01_00627 [Colletotrichum melonis]|uniref:Uncharacterized protein n=1 Tax=Colletotrichum melonis TaxID=1209925 RepID=A0AAI9V3V4_9PEZI|nr:hypothetical protein CMEL01_00627 [Colletotrichum melonis]